MQTQPIRIQDVARWNDDCARENDSDQYYNDSGWLIRAIERRRLHYIRNALAPTESDHLLEVGCAAGYVLREMPEAKITAVDVSEVMLSKARRNLRGYRATFLRGELADFNLPDASFDKIICSEMLEHTVDPAGILAELRRLLKPGGRAVITFPNDRLITTIKRVVRATGLRFVPPFNRVSWGGDKYHLHTWRLAEMRTLIEPHFRIIGERLVPLRSFPIRCCYLCTHHHTP
jgi:ubiquinone/menaquinone biosynthesis C-methylase UbiE